MNKRENIQETERLAIRKLTHDDFETLIAIMGKPEVMYAWEHGFSEDDVRPSLYPYEPKIVKAEGNEDTPFIATFEHGDLVQVKFVGSEEIHDTVFVVEKETKDAIYMKGNHFFLKSQISNIYSLYREEIELELVNTQ